MMQPKESRKILAKWPGLRNDYRDYLITEPVDYRQELERTPDADYDLCCALLTMVVRKEETPGKAFETYVYNGDVIRLLNRMIKVQ